MSRLCQYQNNGVQCKSVLVSHDEEEKYCPLHAGVVLMKHDNETRQSFVSATQSRFEGHLAFCDKLSDEDLKSHILQLDSLLEDVKLRQQAAQHTRTKRLKAALDSGALTREQLEEMRNGRTRKPSEIQAQPKVSKEEKEIAKLVKQGLSREKAIKLLGLE